MNITKKQDAPEDLDQATPQPSGRPKTYPVYDIGPSHLDEDDEVVDATTLADSTVRTRERGTTIRRRWFGEQPELVRFLGASLVPVALHEFVNCGNSSLTLHCNGSNCALCLGHHAAKPSYMVAVLFVDKKEVGAITISQDGGEGSLRGKIIPLLKRPNVTDLIVEINVKERRHNVTVVAELDDSNRSADAYGNSVIRDLIVRGGVRPRDIRNAVERRDNQTLLSDLDWLEPKVRLFHPGIDLAKL